MKSTCPPPAVPPSPRPEDTQPAAVVEDDVGIGCPALSPELLACATLDSPAAANPRGPALSAHVLLHS